jgi:hypothetical protein
MSDIYIVVTPAFIRTGKRKHEQFDAYLRDTGELICTATRQPLLDASRELLARGYDPQGGICKQRDDELFQLGIDDEAPGPFPTIQFAVAVSLRQTRHYPRRGVA